MSFIRWLSIIIISFLSLYGCATKVAQKNANDPIPKTDNETPLMTSEKPLPNYMALAKDLIQHGYYQVAQTQLEEAVHQGQDGAEIHYLIGVCQKERKNVKAAEASFREAIRKSSTFAPAYNGLGMLYEETDRLEKAKTCFEKAVSYDPARVDFLNNLGVLLMNSGQYAEASDRFRQCLAIDAGYRRAINNFAICMGILNPGEAFTFLKRHFSEAEACNNMGAIFQMMDNPEKASEMYSKALTLEPTLAAAKKNIADIRNHKPGGTGKSQNKSENDQGGVP